MTILKIIAVLVAAILVGNWYLAEARKARARREPWYRPYLTLPGMLILLALTVPVIYWLWKR